MGILHDIKEVIMPSHLQPLFQNLQELLSTATKFRSGEGEKEELDRVYETLEKVKHSFMEIPDGPVHTMLEGLRKTALAALKEVKGAEHVVEILKSVEKPATASDVSGGAGGETEAETAPEVAVEASN